MLFSLRSFLAVTLLLSVFMFAADVSKVYAQQFNYWFNEGVALFEMGDVETSVYSFESAIEQDPYHAEAHVYYFSALLGSGQYETAAEQGEEITSRFPNHARLLALRADALYRINPEDALPIFRQLRQLIMRQPDYRKDGIDLAMVNRSLGLLHEQLGGMRYQNRQYDQAIESFRDARRYIPDTLSVHNNLAYIMIEQGQFDQASDVLDEAIERFPDADNLLLMKVRIANERGRETEAVKILQQLHQKNPGDTDRAIAYGQALLNANQAVKANEFFQEMIATYPEERRFYRTLIDINRQRMNLAGMHQVLGMKVKEFPDDRHLAEEYTRSFLMKRDYKTAHQRYDSLATLESSIRLARLAAHALVFGESYEAASDYYITLENKWPDEPAIKREHGLLLEHLKRNEMAAERYQSYLDDHRDGRFIIKLTDLTADSDARTKLLDQALETNYKPFAQRRRLAAVLRQEEDFGLAEEVLDGLFAMYAGRQDRVRSILEQDMQRLEPGQPDLFHARTELSEVVLEMDQVFDRLTAARDFDQALKVFASLSEKWSGSALLSFQKGRLLAHHGQYEEAIEEIREAIQLGAGGQDVHMTYGNVWWKKGNYDQAALSFERVLTEDPEHAPAFRSLIRISEEFGRLDEIADRWLSRYRNNRNNQILREHLIEALHKADRIEEARVLD
ncbi:MAG: hypothetical protein EA363_05705 [Balneolaceae bacterium]|nr:MAG: hypothetical protein EA363_05705 [Balneolaceae bacterium]